MHKDGAVLTFFGRWAQGNNFGMLVLNALASCPAKVKAQGAVHRDAVWQWVHPANICQPCVQLLPPLRQIWGIVSAFHAIINERGFNSHGSNSLALSDLHWLVCTPSRFPWISRCHCYQCFHHTIDITSSGSSKTMGKHQTFGPGPCKPPKNVGVQNGTQMTGLPSRPWRGAEGAKVGGPKDTVA